jgi:redox-sensitive bicupin YhaK (pirin superfamily)
MQRRTFLRQSLSSLGALATTSACSTRTAHHPGDRSMTLTIRRSAERGHANHGWLDTYHTFSFANYYDPEHMGFRSLRVINQDRVAAGTGFSTHPHHDMEIFSYVVEGAIAHQDSMGNGRTLKPGEIQLMSAGTGVTHSEYNPNADQQLHLLQIWIQPDRRGLVPSYTEWKPTPEHEGAKDVVVISPDGRDGSATIHQDAIVHRLQLAAGDEVRHEVRPGRGAWLQLIHGKLRSGQDELLPGDGASTEQAGTLTLTAVEPAEALLFVLA